MYEKSIKLAGLFSFNDYKQNSRTKSVVTAVCFAFLAVMYFRFKKRKKSKHDKPKVIRRHFYYSTALNAQSLPIKSLNAPTKVNALRDLVKFALYI